MSQLKEIGIDTVRSENTAFWTSANAPTQSAFRLDVREVLLHVKVLYLLTDRIVAASFFESEITRTVTLELEPLFSRGEIVYFVDSEVEDFDEHGASKIETSPKELKSYNDRAVVMDRATGLTNLGYILKRPSCSISDKIVDIWVHDLYSDAPGSLRSLLLKYFPNESERLELVSKLVGISRDRGNKSFVWEYLAPKLERLRIPTPLIKASKHRLSTMYSRATSEVLGVAVDRGELTLSSPLIRASSCYDSSIFLRCMDSLGVRDSLATLDAYELIKLKHSPEFLAFKEFYFSLIETVGFQPPEVANWLIKYRYFSKGFISREISVNEFIAMFAGLCKSVKKDARSYSTPLEVLLNTYRLTNVLTIEAFVELIQQLNTTRERTGGVQVASRLRGTIVGERERIITGNLIIPPPTEHEDFIALIKVMIDRFRWFVEEQRGWQLLWSDKSYSTEKSEGDIQLLFKGIVHAFCEANDISIDPEVNFGRGPIDFKFSNGYRRRAHLEIKKLDNVRFWKGLSEQLPSYMRSDRVWDGWFLAVSFRETESNKKKISEIEARVAETSRRTKLNLDFALVDASPKTSASKL